MSEIIDDFEAINQIRALSVDMIENSKSGHPGMALGCAPMIYILFKYFFKYNPKDTNWLRRDRFILSNGHGCALLYSMLHLLGFGISMNDLKNFRKIGSKTPGHPEFNKDLGIDVTTGPLGQGIANGVGMAIASKKLKNKYQNMYSLNDLDNTIFVMCGDGCLMEGISYEAISLAGHLKLDNLILLFDDNGITIDGKTSLTISEDQTNKFKSMGWDVIEVEEGNIDLISIKKAILMGLNCLKPVLIKIKTKIGFASDKENSEKSHGSPLGEESVRELKVNLNLNPDNKFFISDKVKDIFKNIISEKNKFYDNWVSGSIITNNNKSVNKLINENWIEDNLNKIICDFSDKFKNKEKISTRKLSGEFINYLIKNFDTDDLIFGSADLSGSNCINVGDQISRSNFSGNYVNFGIREHSMCAISNGLSTFGYLPIVGTFLVFINYCLSSIRLSALSGHQVIYVLTHDSIGLGEDGPTHQPIESLTILRSIPNLLVFRPANYIELIVSYLIAFKNKNKPSCMCLSRQDIDKLELTNNYSDYFNGCYTVLETNSNQNKIDFILISTGSELKLCLEVAKLFVDRNVRVVSMLCTEIYDTNSETYKEQLLPKDILKISVEAGSTLGWYKYADKCIGIDEFGVSGKGSDVMEHFGFSVDKIYQKISSEFV